MLTYALLRTQEGNVHVVAIDARIPRRLDVTVRDPSTSLANAPPATPIRTVSRVDPSLSVLRPGKTRRPRPSASVVLLDDFLVLPALTTTF